MRFHFPFVWQAEGMVASLEDLPATADVLAKSDVTRAVVGVEPTSHPLLVAALAEGKVIGDLRLAATRNNVVIGGIQAAFGCADLNEHYALKRRRLRLPKFRSGTAWLLGTANSDNYYHWLLESLPRMKILQAGGWGDYDFLLLHSRPCAFQDETLDWLGVPAAKRLRCSKNIVHQFERLVVPTMPFPVWETPAWVCEWLRSLVPRQSPTGPEKIFLSRRGASRRQLANEADLRVALEARGFVTVQAERLSVLEQARLVSAAKCVVAPHGAALTNMVFAPPGALLFELFHPQHKNRCYASLAAACGHHYASLEGRATPAAGNKESKYQVDVEAVLKQV